MRSDGAVSLVRLSHAFGLLPTERLARGFAAQRARFDQSHASPTVPHVTMKQPFVLGEGQLTTHDDFVEWLNRECCLQRPFEVQLDDVGVFDSRSGYGHVVYVRVRVTPSLIELHDRLVRALAQAGARTSGITAENEVALFFPHLTLAQGLSASAARDVLALVQREHVASTFMADRLVIARSREGTRWELAEDVWFGGTALVAEPADDTTSAVTPYSSQ